jgi:tetratricopeptide (TPR) repeat protein
MVLAQDPAAGLDIARQALVEARKQTDPGVVAWALRVVGYGLDLAGDAEGSAAALEDAVQMARRSGDAHVLGVCLLAAAGWHNGRADAAPTTVDAPGRERVGPGGVFETVLAEARSWADATGDTMLRVAVMGTLGYHLLTRGDLAGARHELTSALALARELGSEIMLGNALVNNGLAAYLAGDRDEAGALFREALEPTIARHSALETANATLGLALVIENQDGEVSALLHGAADARCAAVGYQREDVDERASAASKERLRAQLGEHRLTGLLNDGAALSLDSIIELAARAGVPRPPERSEAGRQRVQNLGHGASFELG